MNPFPALVALGIGLGAAALILSYEKRKKAPADPRQTPDYEPPGAPMGPIEIPGLRGRSVLPKPSVWSEAIQSSALPISSDGRYGHGMIPLIPE